ncbi:MAG: hypothetical protein ACI9N1_000010 [Flavobacteriales bacterium]|jgi:hypothetical protein
MKNVFKATLFSALVILMSACGGSADSGNFVGEWVPDLSKVELNLSEEIPAEMRAEIEKGMVNKDELAKAQSRMEDEFKMEFKEDGKLLLEMNKESQELDWKIDGSNLVISGNVEGMGASIALEVLESTTEMFTLKLDGVSILEQIESQLPPMVTLDQALSQVQAMSYGVLAGIDLKTAIEESSMQFGFNKK